MNNDRSKKDLVKRTAELEKELAAKSYELKIEAALEKVSIAAMSMRRSKDLSGIGSLIFKELKKLGFPDLRNSEIIINNDAKETITSYYYSDYGVTGVIELDYKSNAIVKGWADQLKKASNAFAEVVIPEKEMKAWRKYRVEIGYLPDPKLDKAKTVYYYSYSTGPGALSISSFKPVAKEQIKILKRFRNVFQLSYQRYADITLAAAQAREAEIELALERVRARTMAMQKSDELPETTFLLFQQLKELGETAAQLSIGIIKEEQGVVELSATVHGSPLLQTYPVPASDPYFMQKVIKPWKAKEKFLTVEIRGKELKEYNKWRNSVLKKKIVFPEKQWIINVVFFSKGMISFSSDKHISQETIQLLERFAAVFDLTYTRFLDLKNAEAQAREAQIEAALERVRGRSMAMHNSSELHDVIKVVTEQLSGLGIKFDHASFGKNDAAGNWDLWISTPEQVYPSQIHLPYFDHRIFNDQVKTNLDFFTELYSAEEKNIFFRKFFETTEARNIPEERKQYVLNDKGVARSFFRLENLWFVVGKYDDKLFTDEENNIFKRFAIVFEQSYTRFLDLQKAEAQTREAHIETALERVRAKAMAMHSSKDLSETISVFYRELKSLSVTPRRCGVALINKETLLAEITTMNTTEQGDSIEVVGQIKMKGHPVLDDVFENWLVQKEYHAVLRGNQIKEYYQVLKPQVTYPDYPHDVVQYGYYFMFKEGDVYAWTDQELKEDELKIYRRFTTVISLTYKRYKDLQQAETQAREAQIEAALEKVRSRSLAMHKSDELQEVVNTVFERLRELNVEMDSANIAIFKEGTRDYDYWIASPVQKRSAVFHMPYIDPGISKDLMDARETHTDVFLKTYSFEEKNEWFERSFQKTDFKFLDEQRKKFILDAEGITVAIAFAKNTGVQINRYSSKSLAEAEIDILKRFAKVFEQAYIRFLDLQKAEAQAREAQIETALERVRSRTMAMHNSNDVGETVGVTFDELKKLGIEAIRCGIGIMHEHKSMEVWTAKPGETGKTDLIIGHIDMNLHALVQGAFNGWSNKHESFSYELKGNDLVNYFTAINNHSEYPVQYDITTLPSVIFHNDFYFSEGTLFAFTTTQLSEEFRKIFKRFAGVFGQTYRRYLDLQKAEAQAREAQIETSLERVRSRTMAMHNSNDVGETVATMFAEFVHLGIHTNRCGILIFNDQYVAEVWTARSTPGGNAKLIIGKLDLDAHKMLRSVYNAWKAKETFYQYDLLDDDLVQYYTAINNSKFYPTQFDLNALPSKEFHSDFLFADGAVFSFTNEPVAEEYAKIIKRFALVFGQTYRRYLDLQKAEAQTREAQIELALERVRAKAMAMQRSDELNELIGTVSTELGKLDIVLDRCFILIYDTNTLGMTWWMSNPETSTESIGLFVKYHEQPPYLAFIKAWRERIIKWQYILEGETKKTWDKFLFVETELSLLPDFVIANMRANERVYLSASFNNFGCLTLATLEPLPDEQFDIMLRFAKVFDLTYTRFNDLKQAEAQAREAQIQLSLERVRARTMAMHGSDELDDLVKTLFEELIRLDVKLATCLISTFDISTLDETTWMFHPITREPYVKRIPYNEQPFYHEMLRAWKERNAAWNYCLEGETKRKWHDFLFTDTEFALLPQSVTDEMRRPDKVFFTASYYSYGAIQAASLEPFPVQSIDIIQRFSKVFDSSYTRFLDLQKAEAQTRESKIQLSLERVRARTMAMHKSEELAEVAEVLYNQLKDLGDDPERITIGIMSEDNRVITWWATDQGGSQLNIRFQATADEPTVMLKLYNSWKAKHTSLVVDLTGPELSQWVKYCREVIGVPINEEILQNRRVQTAGFFSHGCVMITSPHLPDAETINILERFATVFGLTYRRFLDLQKAEAQAREATIEAALERVRAKAMAMHNSEDLNETIKVFYQQVSLLSLTPRRCGVGLFNKENKIAYVSVMNTTEQGESVETIGKMELTGHPVLKSVYDHWLSQQDYFPVLRGNQIKEYYQFLRPHLNYPDYPNDAVQFGYFFCFPEGALYAWTTQELPEEELNIYRRFTSVLSLTYKRYKDLKQAEAQAREAQIEVSLERVRSKTMAMHSSDDVTSATATMFTELERLGIENMRCGIAHYLEDHKMEVWSVSNLADGKVVRGAGLLDTNSIPFWKIFYSTWQMKEDFLYYLMAGKEKEDYFKKISTLQNYLSRSIEDVPDLSIQTYYFPEGSVWAFSLKPHSEEDKQVMKRFASVFSLTFRRYQDLQKAEAQAREATIEAALEKVRGKAMAMHNSNDLSVTASLVFTELRKLGINPIRCGVGLLNKESQKAQLYSATSSPDGDSLSLVGWAILSEHPVLEKIYESWMDNEEYYPELQGEQMRSYYQLLLKGLPVAVPQVEDDKKQYGTFLPFSVGCLYAWSETPYNETEIKILKRFATIIDLTFRRYIELQTSEANAREAVKQAALDRIRADIASMRTVADLDRITPLIWNELTILGLPFIRCGVFIMDDSQQLIHTFLSTPDGKAIAAFHLPYTTPGNIQRVISYWHDTKKYIDHWDESDFMQFAEILVQQKALASAEEYLKTIPHEGFYLHFLPFLQGMLYVGNTTQLGQEEIELIQHVADAFSTAYARYEDFNRLEAAKQQVEKTLTDLKQAQTLLVQSEKMASLGELTAGIAHEIQNPLNFVNNFSEVSNELLEEMKMELEKGNNEDALAIAKDVKQNLEKIYHHGKRADSIVKGMLQHSRTSSGQKEMTDINSLADEYLRLAYHGLRAKEKSFNAKFETSFDKNVGGINIIPQDIGRVILNLINNAFYTVSEKKKNPQFALGGGVIYEPTVSVCTKSVDGKVLISVKDNGNGIPRNIVDKIFQPFFTTKPTGQGTGLGLSLAYDIIKAHGGDIKVETKEREGTEFIIELPVV